MQIAILNFLGKNSPLCTWVDIDENTTFLDLRTLAESALVRGGFSDPVVDIQFILKGKIQDKNKRIIDCSEFEINEEIHAVINRAAEAQNTASAVAEPRGPLAENSTGVAGGGAAAAVAIASSTSFSFVWRQTPNPILAPLVNELEQYLQPYAGINHSHSGVHLDKYNGAKKLMNQLQNFYDGKISANDLLIHLNQQLLSPEYPQMFSHRFLQQSKLRNLFEQVRDQAENFRIYDSLRLFGQQIEVALVALMDKQKNNQVDLNAEINALVCLNDLIDKIVLFSNDTSFDLRLLAQIQQQLLQLGASDSANLFQQAQELLTCPGMLRIMPSQAVEPTLDFRARCSELIIELNKLSREFKIGIAPDEAGKDASSRMSEQLIKIDVIPRYIDLFLLHPSDIMSIIPTLKSFSEPNLIDLPQLIESANTLARQYPDRVTPQQLPAFISRVTQLAEQAIQLRKDFQSNKRLLASLKKLEIKNGLSMTALQQPTGVAGGGAAAIPNPHLASQEQHVLGLPPMDRPFVEEVYLVQTPKKTIEDWFSLCAFANESIKQLDKSDDFRPLDLVGELGGGMQIWVGNQRSAGVFDANEKDRLIKMNDALSGLQERQIKAIVCCPIKSHTVFDNPEFGIAYFRAPIGDQDTDEYRQLARSFLPHIIAFIVESAQKGVTAIEFHCNAGCSRSAFFAIFTLMYFKNYTVEQAFKLVNANRRFVKPELASLLFELQNELSQSESRTRFDQQVRRIITEKTQAPHQHDGVNGLHSQTFLDWMKNVSQLLSQEPINIAIEPLDSIHDQTMLSVQSRPNNALLIHTLFKRESEHARRLLQHLQSKQSELAGMDPSDDRVQTLNKIGNFIEKYYQLVEVSSGLENTNESVRSEAGGGASVTTSAARNNFPPSGERVTSTRDPGGSVNDDTHDSQPATAPGFRP